MIEQVHPNFIQQLWPKIGRMLVVIGPAYRKSLMIQHLNMSKVKLQRVNTTLTSRPVFEKFVDAGCQLFNAMRLAESEIDHCAAYYEFMLLAPNSVVIDLGCGIGGFGYYLQQIDPSVRIVNVVNDQALIEYMQSVNRDCVYASFECTGLPGACADNVVFNESIGHGALSSTLREASRLLKAGGVLTIKDFSPVNPMDREIALPEWGYTCSREDLVVSIAALNGLLLDCVEHPREYRKHWDELMAEDEEATRVVGGDQQKLPIRQVLYRFRKVA